MYNSGQECIKTVQGDILEYPEIYKLTQLSGKCLSTISLI